MRNPTIQVFVSATTTDLETYRKAVSEELLCQKGDLRIVPVQQDHFSPSYGTISDELTGKIQSSDAVICLVGIAYGAEPKERQASQPRESYTQMEYRLATEFNKPVFVFIASEICKFDDVISEDQEKALLQKSYRERLKSRDAKYSEFHDLLSLKYNVARIDFTRVPQTPKSSGSHEVQTRSTSMVRWFLIAGTIVLLAAVALFAFLNRNTPHDSVPVAKQPTGVDRVVPAPPPPTGRVQPTPARPPLMAPPGKTVEKGTVISPDFNN